MSKERVKNADFAANIRRFMRDAGMIPRDIARRLDVSEQTAYQWRRGKRIPNGPNLTKLCILFHRDPPEFFLPAPKSEPARPPSDPQRH